MRKTSVCLLAAALFVFFATEVEKAGAQQVQVEVGPRIGADRLGFRQFVGGDVYASLKRTDIPLVLNPTFSYYLSTDVSSVDFLDQSIRNVGSMYKIGANALINFTRWRQEEESDSFFDAQVGVGLALSRISYEGRERFSPRTGRVETAEGGNETIPAVNLIANAKFNSDSILSPFLQVRTSIGSDASSPATSLFALSFGLLFEPQLTTETQ